MKTCGKCKLTKEILLFDKNKRMKDGFQNTCRQCRAEYRETNRAKIRASDRDRRLNNLEEVRSSDRAYYHANSDRLKKKVNDRYHSNLEKARAYYLKTKHQKKAYNLLWRLRNIDKCKASDRLRRVFSPGKMAAKDALKRANREKATPSWVDLEAVQEFYTQAKKLCNTTREQWHVDHIDPIKGDLVCGLHVENNLQLLPAATNLAKSNAFKPYTHNRDGTQYLDVKYKLVADPEIYGHFIT